MYPSKPPVIDLRSKVRTPVSKTKLIFEELQKLSSSTQLRYSVTPSIRSKETERWGTPKIDRANLTLPPRKSMFTPSRLQDYSGHFGRDTNKPYLRNISRLSEQKSKVISNLKTVSQSSSERSTPTNIFSITDADLQLDSNENISEDILLKTAPLVLSGHPAPGFLLSKTINDNGNLEKKTVSVSDDIHKPSNKLVKEPVAPVYIFSFSEPIIRGPKKVKAEPPVLKAPPVYFMPTTAEKSTSPVIKTDNNFLFDAKKNTEPIPSLSKPSVNLFANSSTLPPVSTVSSTVIPNFEIGNDKSKNSETRKMENGKRLRSSPDQSEPFSSKRTNIFDSRIPNLLENSETKINNSNEGKNLSSSSNLIDDLLVLKPVATTTTATTTSSFGFSFKSKLPAENVTPATLSFLTKPTVVTTSSDTFPSTGFSFASKLNSDVTTSTVTRTTTISNSNFSFSSSKPLSFEKPAIAQSSSNNNFSFLFGKTENSDLKTSNQKEGASVSLSNTTGNLFELKSANITTSAATTTPNFGFSFGSNSATTSTIAPVTSSSFLSQSTTVTKSDITPAPSFSFGSKTFSSANTLNSNFSFQSKPLNFDKPLTIPPINNGFNFSFSNSGVAANNSTENTQNSTSAPFVFGVNPQPTISAAFGTNGLNNNGLSNASTNMFTPDLNVRASTTSRKLLMAKRNKLRK